MQFKDIKSEFYLSIQQYDVEFPLHFHRNYECFAVKKGKAVAIVDNQKYTISEGEAVLVFPYQKHAYIPQQKNNEFWVCIFSPNLVGSFHNNIGGIPVSNKFDFSNYAIIGEGSNNTVMQKAICYTICGVFYENAKFIEKKSESDDLLLMILQYISDNYKSTCTLQEISKKLNYDYSYVSKFFRRATGCSFNKYVNKIRIDYARELLSETEKSITDISHICGFGTVRNFNKKFLEFTGMSPHNYRNK